MRRPAKREAKPLGARTLLLGSISLTALLGLQACSSVSPHVFSGDNSKPTYGYLRPAAAPAGETPLAEDYYGTLPAAIEATDKLRLDYLKTFNREAMVPTLLEVTLVPGAAYSMYRLATGRGPDMRREILRNGLLGAAALSTAKTLTNPQRQQVRLAAVEALSCAVRASSARYLYRKRDIEGFALEPGGDLSALALIPARETLGKAQFNLVEANDEGLELKARLPKQLSATVKATGYCTKEANRNLPACEGRSDTKDGKVVIDNPAIAELDSALQLNEDTLKLAAPALGDSKTLLSRIQEAGNRLTETTFITQVKVAGAVEELQPTIDQIQGSILNLSQILSSFKAGFTPGTTGSPPPASSTGDGKTLAGQSGTKQQQTTKTATTKNAALEAEIASQRQEIEASIKAMRRARVHLVAALSPVNAFLAEDSSRAREVQALSDCKFGIPTLRLDLTPEVAEVTLRAGDVLVVEADGGSQMPRASMGGLSKLPANALHQERENLDPKRQLLRATLTVPDNAVNQTLELTFRNGDALEQKMKVTITAKDTTTNPPTPGTPAPSAGNPRPASDATPSVK